MADLLTTPQLSLPFRVSGNDVVCHEQDSTEDITQNAITIMRYTQGERSALPEFGIPDQALQQNGADMTEITEAVRRWEPEATVSLVHRLNVEGVDQVDLEIGG